VAGIGIVAGAVILALSFTTNLAIFDFSAQPSVVASAQASQLPVDVKESFKKIEKTGDAKKTPSRLQIDSDFVDPDEHCEFCYRIQYTPGAQGQAGVLFETDKALNLKDAKRMIFWARGDLGGEKIQVSAAGIKSSSAGASNGVKFGVTTTDFALPKTWEKYEIDLSGVDLTSVTHGFELKINKGNDGSDKVMYMKYITYDTLPAKNPVSAAR
jgi:hypothetical protein